MYVYRWKRVDIVRKRAKAEYADGTTIPQGEDGIRPGEVFNSVSVVQSSLRWYEASPTGVSVNQLGY